MTLRKRTQQISSHSNGIFLFVIVSDKVSHQIHPLGHRLSFVNKRNLNPEANKTQHHIAS